MRISASLPQGVAALLFDAARRRRDLEQRLVACLDAAGFAEVVLPILDYLEPYEPLLATGDRGELYRFVDRDGEMLALRADFTPMLARLLAPMLATGPDGGGSALELPLRLYYRGDVVRQENGRERPGGERELYQVGAELVGSAGPAAEGEMLRLFLTLLAAARAESAGEGPVRVVVGFAGALDRPLAEAAAGGADPVRLAAALMRRERAPFQAAGGPAPGGWSATLRAVLEGGLPATPGELGPIAAARLGEVTALARAAAGVPDIAVEIDLAEFADQALDPLLVAPLAAAAAARGDRAYYDGLVFRAYAGSGARPVGSGGRYDRLFRRLGAEVPAVGFSLGLDRLAAVRGRAPLAVARPALAEVAP